MSLGTIGKSRNPWAVIGLSIITLGIYSLYWQYVSFKEMRDYSGTGIGGGLGLLFAFLFFIVNAFLMPAEVGALYTGKGEDPPVSWLTAFWLLIPIVGGIIWVVRTQGSLNAFWVGHGAGTSA